MMVHIEVLVHLNATFQEINTIYEGSPSERSSLDTIPIAQRIHKKFELKRCKKVQKPLKTKTSDFPEVFYSLKPKVQP